MPSDGAEPPVFVIDAARGADGETAISVGGELDLANADQLGAAVREGLASGDVTVDLSDLAFMDSAGVRALNAALREADAAGRRLRVRKAMQPSVVQILELTGMMALLDVADDAP
ncbi:MAG TPA: STAS domain-containing protein [Solirubrobacteraceae bacterium]